MVYDSFNIDPKMLYTSIGQGCCLIDFILGSLKWLSLLLAAVSESGWHASQVGTNSPN